MTNPIAKDCNYPLVATELQSAIANLQNQINLLKASKIAQTGAFGSDLNDGNWKLHTGTGVRSVSYYIKFPSAFTTPPTVSVSLKHLDSSREANTRLAVNAKDIATDGFTVEFTTWADTIVYGASISWVAVTN